MNSFEWGKDTVVSVRFNPGAPNYLATSARFAVQLLLKFILCIVIVCNHLVLFSEIDSLVSFDSSLWLRSPYLFLFIIASGPYLAVSLASHPFFSLLHAVNCSFIMLP